MEKLKFSPSILRQILNDREAVEELREYLNSVIDEELSKDENADCDLIDECIDALEELEFENTTEKPHLTVLLSEDKFIKNIQKKSYLHKDKYKKLAVICASAAILIAAGSVKTDSGQTVAKVVTNKIAAVFHIKNIDAQPEKITETNTSFTEPITEKPGEEPVTEKPSEELTTEKPSKVLTTEKPGEVPTTEKPSEAPTTEKPSEKPTVKEADPVTLEKIYGVLSKKAKTEYKIGEEFSTEGLQIFAVHSDGKEKQIPIDDCTVSVPNNFSKNAGKKTVTVNYQGKTFSYDVKVYAEKTSVILNSIYGTFPDGFSFKTDSFDNMDFSKIAVTAVYSDGSEKNIPIFECEITVEKNFMDLENKAMVTVTYEECSFSFIMTKEEQQNETV